ncbi:hypothetical protein B0H19DRAFT_1253696 [Mycena capillaripes]|nr:hypothetical protein B0H19DRAFT_1253696 [Mycena capillaripes]
MSETASAAQIQDSINICRTLIVVPFTVLVYDYLLTFEREVSGFWGTRMTWGSLFFYLNRYSPLFGNLPILVQYFSTTTNPAKMPLSVSPPLPNFDLIYYQVPGIPSIPPVFRVVDAGSCGGSVVSDFPRIPHPTLDSAILIMRTYALFERSKRVLALTLLVTLGAFISAICFLLTGNDIDTLSAEIATFGCPIGTSHSKGLRLAAAWSGMLVFDVTIFGLTLFKALTLKARRGDLLTVLLRDGSVYFALMVISNACNIGTYTMGDPFTRGSATTVVNVVSSIMISRLMFNLRDPKIRLPQSHNRTTRSSTAEDYPAISTVSPYTTEYTMNTQWTTSDD